DQAIIAQLEDDDADWIPLDQETPLEVSIAASLDSPPSLPLETKTPARRSGPPKRAATPPAPRIVDTAEHHRVSRSAREDPSGTPAGFKLPPIELLQAGSAPIAEVDRASLLEQAARLEKTLSDYGVSGRVEEIHPGPTVTTFELAPEAGTKVSKVSNLTD